MAETRTLSAAAYSALGTPRSELPLPADPFDGTINMPVLHRAVKAYLTNQRQGNAATKTRGFVTGGNQKPWRQKGTGRARQGSTRAPNWPGGGTVFGPLPKEYAERIPRRMKELARKSALNARASEAAIYVIDAFAYDAPRTARLRDLLARLGVAQQKVLVLTDGAKPNVFLSGRNLPNVHVMPFRDAGTYHILWCDSLVVESAALGTPLTPLVEDAGALPPIAKRAPAPAPAPGKAAAAARQAKPSRAEGTAAKRSGKGAKKGPAAPAPASAKAAGKSKAAAKKASAKKPAAKKSAATKPSAKRGRKKGA
ncbi:MAG: 50S ribosomal protein L4 [Gemmatimonadaceae bacterium]